MGEKIPVFVQNSLRELSKKLKQKKKILVMLTRLVSHTQETSRTRVHQSTVRRVLFCGSYIRDTCC